MIPLFLKKSIKTILIGLLWAGAQGQLFSQCNYEVDLGPDTTVCDYISLTVETSNIDDIIWSTGEKVRTIRVSNSGSFWVGVRRQGCGYKYDTVQIQVIDGVNPSNNVKDTAYFCPGDSITVNAGDWENNASYLWSDGSTDTTKTFWSAYSGWVEVTNDCETERVEFHILPLRGGVTDFLEGDTICTRTYIPRPTVNFPDASYLWSTGNTSISQEITSSGTYWLEVTTPCGVFTDTADIYLSPDPEEILPDTLTLCAGFSRYLGPPYRENVDYQWSTGETSDSILVTSPGTYWYEAHGACESVYDTVHVKEVFPIDQPLPNDTSFCEPDSLLLHFPGIHVDSVRWSDGSTAERRYVDTTGSYSVIMYNACGSFVDVIDVEVKSLPQEVIPDTSFCYNSDVTVSAAQPRAFGFEWSTGDTTPSVSIDEAGQYYVDITNECGTTRNTFDVGRDTTIAPFSLGPDTVVCDTPLTLSMQIPEATHFYWNDTLAAESITISESGTYWFTAWNACNTYTDTIEVTFAEVPRFSLEDTIYCYDGTPATITGPPDMESYQWSTGATTRSITVDTAMGVYSLTVENECFSYTDSLLVDPQQEIELDLGPDTSLCFGETVLLGPEPHRYGYAWSDGSTDSVLEVTRPGTFWVFSSNACDFYYDTVQVDFHYPLDPRPLDTVLCQGDSIVLDFSSDLYDVEWGDDFVGDVRTVKDTGEYSVTIHNECGSYVRDISIGKGECECPFFAADAFTPNRDGENDTYFPKYGCDLSYYKMTIVSKAGGVLFETEDPTEGWDGTFNGERMPQGVYIYHFEYRWSEYGVERSRTKRGTVLLIR